MFLFLGTLERLDVSFALDSSADIPEMTFQKMKDFVLELVKTYNVSANHTRISLISYGSKPISQLQFASGIYESVVEQALFAMSPVGGERKLSDALSFIAENVFARKQDTGKLLVLIVSGKNAKIENDEAMKRALAELKAGDIKFVILGIGKEIKRELSDFSDPGKIITVNDADDLKQAFSKVIDESSKAAGTLCKLCNFDHHCL